MKRDAYWWRHVAATVAAYRGPQFTAPAFRIMLVPAVDPIPVQNCPLSRQAVGGDAARPAFVCLCPSGEPEDDPRTAEFRGRLKCAATWEAARLFSGATNLARSCTKR